MRKKFEKKMQVSDMIIDFLTNQRDRMIVNLKKRMGNKYNTDYPKEAFYE